MDVVGSKHVVGHVALVQIDMSPLTALRLVAGHGIGELYLQGIVELVRAHMLHAVGLQGDVGIIGEHALE